MPWHVSSVTSYLAHLLHCKHRAGSEGSHIPDLPLHYLLGNEARIRGSTLSLSLQSLFYNYVHGEDSVLQYPSLISGSPPLPQLVVSLPSSCPPHGERSLSSPAPKGVGLCPVAAAGRKDQTIAASIREPNLL